MIHNRGSPGSNPGWSTIFNFGLNKQVNKLNLKKAKALRKVLRKTEEYIVAPIASVLEYVEKNIRSVTNPNPPHNVITTCTLVVPPESKRGIYLLNKSKVKKSK